MEYALTKPQRKFRGPVHWGHTISMYVAPKRMDELKDFLNEVVGENQWRIAKKHEKKSKGHLSWFFKARFDAAPTRIKFLEKNHAVRVKLMWDECEQPKNDDFFIRPLPGGSSLHYWQKMMFNSVYGTLRVGKSIYFPQPKPEEVTRSAKEAQERILSYIDSEASFDFSKVRANGKRMNLVTIDDVGEKKLLSLSDSMMEKIKEQLK